MKRIISAAWMLFKKWFFNPRITITLAVCVFVYELSSEPLITNGKLTGERINALEPFIAALNSGTLLLIIPLGFLALISDFPSVDKSTMLWIIRIGKLKWLFSELIRLVFMSVFYIFVILVSSAATVIPYSFWGTEWSDTATKFTIEFPEYSQNFGALLLPKNLYNQLEIIPAAVLSIISTTLYLIFLGTILVVFTVCSKKSAGVIFCGAIITVGSALCSLKSDFMWIFPMPHSIMWLHFTEFRKEQAFPIWLSIIYLVIGIISFVSISLIKVRKFDISNI